MGAPFATAMPASAAEQVPTHHPLDGGIQEENSDQWEYEYAEDETEDFYITLDVSAHRDPHGRGNSDKNSNTANRRGAAVDQQSSDGKRKRGGVGGGDEEDGEARQSLDREAERAAKRRRRSSQADDNDRNDDNRIPGEDDTEPAIASMNKREIQILDLHTLHPFLSHQSSNTNPSSNTDDNSSNAETAPNTISTLSWSTDLGTQFHLSTLKTITPVRRRGYKVDIVALSRVRLTAHPLVLQPKRNPTPTTSGSRADVLNGHPQETPHSRSADTGESGRGGGQQQTHSFINEHSTNPALSASAAVEDAERTRQFRLRLAEIKKRKGETDRVPLGGILDYGARARIGVGSGERPGAVVDVDDGGDDQNGDGLRRDRAAVGAISTVGEEGGASAVPTAAGIQGRGQGDADDGELYDDDDDEEGEEEVEGEGDDAADGDDNDVENEEDG